MASMHVWKRTVQRGAFNPTVVSLACKPVCGCVVVVFKNENDKLERGNLRYTCVQHCTAWIQLLAILHDHTYHRNNNWLFDSPAAAQKCCRALLESLVPAVLWRYNIISCPGHSLHMSLVFRGCKSSADRLQMCSPAPSRQVSNQLFAMPCSGQGR